MDMIRYLTNAAYGILGWTEQETVVIKNSKEDTAVIETKVSLTEFLKTHAVSEDENVTDNTFDSDFDQKLINRKNYNRKKKQQKNKKF